MLDSGLKVALSAMKQNILFDEEELYEERPFVGWEVALKSLFPNTFKKGFSEAQIDYWNWVWSINPKDRPRPYVLILPRGGGKTTSCEVTPILLGADNVRKYCWYIQETQSQADKRVDTIAEKLESPEMSLHYPLMSERWIGKFGNIGGWRRSFVRTSSNVVFEAVGLDRAARSSKIGDMRPDLIIIDDVDSKFDTDRAIQKKLDLLTHTLLPAAASNAVIIFVQNLVHYNSIASRLSDVRNTEFLQDRIISGPHPAMHEFETARVYDEDLGRNVDKIVYGFPLWEGQGVEECQNYINTFGLTSFKTECQHEVENIGGSVWAKIQFVHCEPEDVPDLEVGCVWCDPAVTDNDDSAANGIQADGLGIDGKIYRFLSHEEQDGPVETIKTAILWAVELGFDYVGIETDQGGDLWEITYDNIWDQLIKDRNYPEIGDTIEKPEFFEAKAGAGFGSKAHRNSLMLADYEGDNVVHVLGFHKILEGALYRFLRIKPYDLADAAFWGWDFLKNRRWEEMLADAR